MAGRQAARMISSASMVRTEPGRADQLHVVGVPGLVPDARETFLRQRALMRSFGGVSLLTYPHDHFDLEEVMQQLDATLVAARDRGERPVLMGVSVGGGFVLELLRRYRERGVPSPVAGVVLISPFTCTLDLASMLQRVLGPIYDEHDRALGQGQDSELVALERGRTFFRGLATRAVPAEAPSGAWRFLRLFTPSGIAAMQEERIRARIEHTLGAISGEGAVQRCVALRSLRGIADLNRTAVTDAPTLILWGSKERHTLNMEGPGTSVLCRPDLAYRLFPNLEIHWCYAADGEEVPHASLLKHYRPFNLHLRRFLTRVNGKGQMPLLRGLPFLRASRT